MKLPVKTQTKIQRIKVSPNIALNRQFCSAPDKIIADPVFISLQMISDVSYNKLGQYLQTLIPEILTEYRN